MMAFNRKRFEDVNNLGCTRDIERLTLSQEKKACRNLAVVSVGSGRDPPYTRKDQGDKVFDRGEKRRGPANKDHQNPACSGASSHLIN